MAQFRIADALAEARNRIRSMHPGTFALAMATGIVSLGCNQLGMGELAAVLFGINIVAFAGLWAALLARAVLAPQELMADFTSHQRAPGFFTLAVASCVLGVQFLQIGHASRIAFCLWLLGLALWVACTYTVFVALGIREGKPALPEGINGGWLVSVVATQAICVLGSQVLPGRLANPEAAWFLLTAFWLCGGMLYIWLISLIFYRYTFYRFAPEDAMPTYWVNMGAVAISTLAGAYLCRAIESSAFLTSIGGFVRGFTLLFWATASWWIPLLLVLGIWRHGFRRVRFAYDPLYWSLVFPLGMYSVCTSRLALAFGMPGLVWFSRIFIVAAIVAWLFTFSGLATRLLHLLVLASKVSLRPQNSRRPALTPISEPGRRSIA